MKKVISFVVVLTILMSITCIGFAENTKQPVQNITQASDIGIIPCVNDDISNGLQGATSGIKKQVV